MRQISSEMLILPIPHARKTKGQCRIVIVNSTQHSNAVYAGAGCMHSFQHDLSLRKKTNYSNLQFRGELADVIQLPPPHPSLVAPPSRSVSYVNIPRIHPSPPTLFVGVRASVPPAPLPSLLLCDLSTHSFNHHRSLMYSSL